MENEFDEQVAGAIVFVFWVIVVLGLLAGCYLVYYIYKDDHAQVARVFSGKNKCELTLK